LPDYLVDRRAASLAPIVIKGELDRVRDGQPMDRQLGLVKSTVALIGPPHTLSMRPAFGFILLFEEPALAAVFGSGVHLAGVTLSSG
jgi:hypothetical protein